VFKCQTWCRWRLPIVLLELHRKRIETCHRHVFGDCCSLCAYFRTGTLQLCAMARESKPPQSCARCFPLCPNSTDRFPSYAFISLNSDSMFVFCVHKPSPAYHAYLRFHPSQPNPARPGPYDSDLGPGPAEPFRSRPRPVSSLPETTGPGRSRSP
jgi:hypothetical protein